MPKVVSHLRIMIPLPADPPPQLAEKWARRFEDSAEQTNENRKKAIPTSEKFDARLATPSSQAYSNSLNPNFISKAGQNARDIIARQSANLKGAFKKYQDSLDHIYETVDGVPAKRLKEKIRQKKQHFSEGIARKVMPFTGCGPENNGVIQIAIRWLTHDVKVEGMLRGGDEILGGSPILITTKETAPAFRAALAGRLQQAGIVLVDTPGATQILKEQNDRTNNVAQMFADPGLGLVPFTTGGDSHVDFVVDKAKQLALNIKVSKA